MARTILLSLALISLLSGGCQSTRAMRPSEQIAEVSSAFQADFPDLLPSGSRLVWVQASLPSRWPGQDVCGWVVWDTAEGQRVAAPYVGLMRDGVRRIVIANAADRAATVHEHCVVPQVGPAPTEISP